MQREKSIITDLDHQRLRSALKQAARREDDDQERLDSLRQRVREARVVSPKDVPGNVVTMNSLVVLRSLDSGAPVTMRLAYPHEARRSPHSVSVSGPLGTAMLGKRVGQIIRWPRGRTDRRMRIQQVLYQPEAAGDFDL
jgi:regulator of nucleoside diphosphate kinase